MPAEPLRGRASKRVPDTRYARPMNRAAGAFIHTTFVTWGESPQLGSCAEGAEPASTASPEGR